MTKLAPSFWHSFPLPLRTVGIYLQMSSVLQGHATGRCFNQTTVKYSYCFAIHESTDWDLSFWAVLLICDIYLKILYSSCTLGTLERSGQAEGCVWSVWGLVSFPEFATSHSLLDRKEHMLWLQSDYSLSMAGSNCCFEIIFPVLYTLTSRKEEIAHMSTQIILQDAGMAPVLTFVIFSIPIMSHDFWSDYQNQVQELWGRPQGT